MLEAAGEPGQGRPRGHDPRHTRRVPLRPPRGDPRGDARTLGPDDPVSYPMGPARYYTQRKERARKQAQRTQRRPERRRCSVRAVVSREAHSVRITSSTCSSESCYHRPTSPCQSRAGSVVPPAPSGVAAAYSPRPARPPLQSPAGTRPSPAVPRCVLLQSPRMALPRHAVRPGVPEKRTLQLPHCAFNELPRAGGDPGCEELCRLRPVFIRRSREGREE